MEIAVYALTLALSSIGLLGVILPILPGTTLILAAMVLHKVILPESLAWTAFLWIGTLWALSVLGDIAGVVLGTRLGGGGRWGMAGAGIGTLIGMWFSLRALFFGTILGAIAAEKLFAGKTDRAALRAGLGAAAGFALSAVVRLGCGVTMIVLFALSTKGSWLG